MRSHGISSASASIVSSGNARWPALPQASSTKSRTALRSSARTLTTLTRGEHAGTTCCRRSGREQDYEAGGAAGADRCGAPVEAVGGRLHGGGRRFDISGAVVVGRLDGGPGVGRCRREGQRGRDGGEDAGGIGHGATVGPCP